MSQAEDKYTWHVNVEADCMACFLGRGETEDKVGFVDEVKPENGAVGLVFDKTNFYAEQGGQIYDQGEIVDAAGNAMRVDSVQVFGGYVLHLGEITSGSFKVGGMATLKVNYARRAPIASNHTMTHVLNYALREVLIGKANIGKTDGPQLDQKGR